ncbi:hypothetical protein [Petrotoga sp. 9PWA.NaAc.5.4]|uniref:hypothetical protein n=1 Tax=Petrotoga sp. 9PWA.NaAc.5.4 TaxID=1434328 RepID=UPI000CB831D5|nr:hypothetical protein [Petrotoga sp. 9PWA.NaAc.5.4]PNR92571.1 hypothetical protein X924_09590 [Petrotoga sp. 9PWA.NaAc.5.4]
MADEKNKKEKTKRKHRKLWRFLIIAFIVAIFLLGFGYIYFEYSRLSYFNLNLQNSWRSYLAYLIDFVPGLRNLSKYEYLEIGDPLYLQKELLDMRFQSLRDEREQLATQKQELETLLSRISQESEKLMMQREELDKLSKEYEQKIAEFNDYNNRIATLGTWLSRSTPQQIANALVREEVSVELLVDTLMTLESKAAAEILQAIALVNPQKAAEIIAKMGEKGRNVFK